MACGNQKPKPPTARDIIKALAEVAARADGLAKETSRAMARLDPDDPQGDMEAVQDALSYINLAWQCLAHVGPQPGG